MRAAEWLNLAFFTFFAVFAVVRPLPGGRRATAVGIGLAGLLLNSAVIFSSRFLPVSASAVLRDWLPAPLMLMAYWQAGQFFRAPDARLQTMLETLDRRWLAPFFERTQKPGAGSSFGAYLEFAYLFCYPMVPLALGTLYLAGYGGRAAGFWTIVLPASYLCYAMVPFFQTLPPRVQEEQRLFGLAPGWLRRLNLGVLHRASIQANTFPSAHVAASLAASLAVLRDLPWAGAALLWISLSIAAGAVLRRYHYLLDVLAGAGVAVAVVLLVTLFSR